MKNTKNSVKVKSSTLSTIDFSAIKIEEGIPLGTRNNPVTQGVLQTLDKLLPKLKDNQNIFIPCSSEGQKTGLLNSVRNNYRSQYNLGAKTERNGHSEVIGFRLYKNPTK